jgi:Flp pilus assembly pilin Flp
MRSLKNLWHDEDGFVATTDMLLIAAIVVLGTVVGLVTLRDSVVQEFADVAQALAALNQSYEYEGTNFDNDTGLPIDADECYVAGSFYEDATDAGQGDDTPGAEPFGISVTGTAGPENDPLP